MTMVAPMPKGNAPPRVTPEQLLGIPDNNSMELVDGQIVEKNVSVESSKTELIIAARLIKDVGDPPLAEVFPASLGYQCFPSEPDKVRKPDVTVVRSDRVRELPPRDPGYMPIVPDLAVEVISPNDVHYEVVSKVREYLDAGFPLIWIVDPKSRTVTVHAAGADPILLSESREITAESALPGFRCKVADLFPPKPAVAARP